VVHKTWGLLGIRVEMAPIVDQRLSEVVIIMIKEKPVTFLEKVDMGVERNIRIETAETGRNVATEGDVGDG
jgi:hypothetical protein